MPINVSSGLTLLTASLDVDIYHCVLQTRVCISSLTIYHIINISPSGQYLYSCSCKSFRHNPGSLDLLCHDETKIRSRPRIPR